MTRAEAARAARAQGYNDSDASWLTRTAPQAERTRKELTHVELTFHAGRLVALREGTYNPVTRRIDYRTIDLCASAR